MCIGFWPDAAGQGCHVCMTQHDVNVMCCSNFSTPHWLLQGVLSSALEAGVCSQHRRGIYSRDMTAVEAALPHSCSGAWDAARLSAAPQVQLSWGRKPCVVVPVQFDGVRAMYAA
jgi:hypothetical protein